MIIVITQPTFIPWIGYFDQLRIADIVVFLDSVQYQRRSWQNRNRIINRLGKECLLTIPLKKSPRNTLIKDINISDTFKLDSFLDKIKSSYRGASNLENCLYFVKKSLSKKLMDKSTLLKDINRQFIEDILDSSDIKFKTFWSSDFESLIKYNTPTERLVEICKYFKASTYLSAPGSRDYMIEELKKFSKFDINVKWHSFSHRSYVNGEFKPYMSIIDYLAHNKLENLKKYLKECSKVNN